MLRRPRGDEEPASGAAPPAAGASVLVVSDKDGSCELLRRLLRTAGFEVEHASNAGQAMSLLALMRPACAVLDLSVAGAGHNLELLATIRRQMDARVANTPVVLITQQKAGRLFAWKAGTDALLVRPFHARELVEAVRDVIARPAAQRAAYRRRQVEAATASP